MNSDSKKQGAVDLLERKKDSTSFQTPKMFHVYLLNDNETPMDFVIHVLIQIFDHPLEKAEEIMLRAHTTGKALCGTYVYDIARTKVMQVHEEAMEYGFPLKAIYEEA